MIGVLPVDKPAGPSSHQVVIGLRKTLGEGRIGHTGTLDPFATGLLLCLVGEATRLAEFLKDFEKEYVAEARLGWVTDTEDPEGQVLDENDRWQGLVPETIESALLGFIGPQLQRPSSFSAKKRGGEAAYVRARRGEVVELEPVPVTIHDVELLSVELPLVRFRVRCSAGTFIRALARDLGEQLGTGASLTSLRRTRVGPFTLDASISPEAIRQRETVEGQILPPQAALAHLPVHTLNEAEVQKLRLGQRIARGTLVPEVEGLVALLLGDALVAIGETLPPFETHLGGIRPRKVFAPISAAAAAAAADAQALDAPDGER